jgi:hypothetical protein
MTLTEFVETYNLRPEYVDIKNNVYTNDIKISNQSTPIDIPSGLIIAGNLILVGCDGSINIPNDLVVEGTMNVIDCDGLMDIPVDVVIGRGVRISRCNNFTNIPNGFVCGGSLSIYWCKNFTTIPPELTVQRSLFVYECPNVKNIPQSVVLGGSLYRQPTTPILQPTDQYQALDSNILEWRNGTYLKTDDRVMRVDRVRSKYWNVTIIIGWVGIVDGFLVTDGDGNYAVSRKLKDARGDIKYKRKNKNKNVYKRIKKTDVLTFDQAIRVYMSITDAQPWCVKRYISEYNIEEKSYTLQEVIDILDLKRAPRRDEFKKFFT